MHVPGIGRLARRQGAAVASPSGTSHGERPPASRIMSWSAARRRHHRTRPRASVRRCSFVKPSGLTLGRRVVKNAARLDTTTRRARPPNEQKMRTWSLLALALSGLLFAGELSSAEAPDKDTLVIALDTLGAQIMDPIMVRARPHAHYQAPVWDSLVGFDLANGGIAPASRSAGSSPPT